MTEAGPPAPPTLGGWLASNAMPLTSVAGLVVFVAWKGLYVMDVGLALLGLGLVIFLHELGHFVAAKLCDVHVETFSIGFGKAIPGCQFKYGETTYKIGWVPLGGYVKMVGEGDNADTDEADEDPRSFKHKSVGQRMAIISAGVIMNIILGVVCFVVAYSHGVEEPPGIIGYVGSGSPAWQAGVRSDTLILSIGSIEKPMYPDIRSKIMASSKGDIIPLHVRHRDGSEEVLDVAPKRDEGELFPTIGIGQTNSLVIQKSNRPEGVRPARPSSAAARAVDAEGNGFKPGDRIVASSHDPAKPTEVKDLPLDPRDPMQTKLDFFAFRERMDVMRGKPMLVRVERDGQRIDLTVPPEYTHVIPGVRLQSGRITAIRNNSPAARAKPLEPGIWGGLVPMTPGNPDSGDKIIAVEVTDPDGKKRRFVDTPEGPKVPNVQETILDPTRLPFELAEWAERTENRVVRITVVRTPTDSPQKTPKRFTFELDWDATLRFAYETALSVNAPTSVPALGFAYQIDTTIDDVAKGSAAEAAGLRKADVITAFRYRYTDAKGELKESDWADLTQHQATVMFARLQEVDSDQIDLKVRRQVENEQREEELTISLATVPDQTWPTTERGFYFEMDTRTQKAEDLWEAVQFGAQRSVRMVRTIYQQLYALISGRISAKTMSGPLSIANYSYKIVGQDTWAFIVFIGMISLNLAVVNFLPIPVLDGGHMVFLIYEKVRGKPAPDKVMEWALYTGLAMILSLMGWVIFQDVKRLFF